MESVYSCTYGLRFSHIFLLALLLSSTWANDGAMTGWHSSYSGGSVRLPPNGQADGKCERITLPLCTSMKYNLTLMPNLVGHSSQKEAEQEIHEFIPLIQLGCSKLLTFFLCSLYAPMCTEQVDDTLVIPPCRSMCTDVRSKCEPILQSFHIPWPSKLECSGLPERSDRNNLCIDASGGDGKDDGFVDGPWGTAALPGDGISFPGGLANNEALKGLMEYMRKGGKQPLNYPGINEKEVSKYVNELGRYVNEGEGDQRGGKGDLPNGQCPPRFVSVQRKGFRYRGNGNSNVTSCAPRCLTEVLFTAEDKRFSEIWMLLWAAVSLISTTATILTFLLDPTRFPYPQRPVVLITFCSLFHTVGYFLTAALERPRVTCDTASPSQELFIIGDGLENSWCIVIFLFLYFFGMSASVWWVVLTLTFYLTAGRKWGHEAVERVSCWFHAVAWAGPALLTISTLTMRLVDGDELYGLCYVGNQDPNSLTIFVIVPLALCLVVGILFLLAGFISMFRIRRKLKVGSSAPVSTPLMPGGGEIQRMTPLPGGQGRRPSTMGSSGIYYSNPAGQNSSPSSSHRATMVRYDSTSGQGVTCVMNNNHRPNSPQISQPSVSYFPNGSLAPQVTPSTVDHSVTSYIGCCCCRTIKNKDNNHSQNSSNRTNTHVETACRTNNFNASNSNILNSSNSGVTSATLLDIRRFERLMLKVGLFALLYAVPAGSVLACYMYERWNMEEWNQDAMRLPCSSDRTRPGGATGKAFIPQSGTSQETKCGLDRSIASVELFSLKTFMLLAVGSTCCVWIWSAKTLQMWQRFFQTVFCRRRNLRNKNKPEFLSRFENCAKPQTGNKNLRENLRVSATNTRFPPLPSPPSSAGVSVHSGVGNMALYTPVTTPHCYRIR